MSNRYEGYPESWIDPLSCAFIKDGVVTHLIMLDPEHLLEDQFKDQFNADSWIYADEAFKAGATTCPSVGYSYDGTDFFSPITESPTAETVTE